MKKGTGTSMRGLRFLCIIVAAGGVLLPLVQAQTSSVVPRVVAPVDESSLATLAGNVSPLARAEFDHGEALPETELRSVRLVLSRSSAQEAELDKLMMEQLDKSSPNYHKWLTPEQFGQIYGPADSDIAAIEAWLQSHGLTVESVSTGRTNIAFSGTVSQMEEAFHTSIHSYEVAGRQFYANISNPRIPNALASVVTGIAHLNTLEPRPHSTVARPGVYDPERQQFAPTSAYNRLARPEFTNPSGFFWVTPADAATIYDTPNKYNALFSSATGHTGAGVTIGIGGESAIKASTVVNYRSRFLNGDTTAPIITNVNNSAVAGGATNEAYIDTELAGGLAPGATIHFYTADNNAGGLFKAIDTAVTDNKVDIFSLSFGLCEYYLTTSDNAMIAKMWQQAASQGIAVTVSTGDNGSGGCDDPNSASSASTGLQVSGWASTPYNIAVGGTDFYGLLSNFSAYVNNNKTSSDFYRSANSYIPESTWNDSVNDDGLLANNTPYGLGSNQTNIIAGSGGVSACSSNTDRTGGGKFILGTCTSGYAKPVWQRGPGVPDDKARDLPDISLMAGNGLDDATWLICTDDKENGTGYPENCATQPNKNFYYAGYGGTSTSAPAFAGILALLQDAQGGHRLGLDAVKLLYDLYNTPHAASVFHDTTQGNISVYCSAGSPDCKKDAAGYNFLSGYNTTTGYDLATGLGSVDATQLINLWGAGSGALKAIVSVTPSSDQITTAEALQVAVTVTGSSSIGTPTGTVTLSGGGYTSTAESLDSTGAYTFNVPAGALAPGNDTLTVSYSGDSNYASTSGSANVTVTAITVTPTVAVTPASASIDTSQSLDVAVAVTGTGGVPIGTVTLTGGGYTSSAVTLSNGAATITIPANSLSAASSVTLTVTYSGDATYTSATGTATIAVTQSVFALAASAPAAIAAGTSATSTITVSSTSGYSGTVTLACALTSSPAGATNLPGCAITSGSPVTLSSSTTSATATVTVTTTGSTSAKLDRGRLGPWTGAGGGAVLALLFFIGMPARRRSWRNLLGLVVLLAIMGSLSACGSSGGIRNQGTTSGNYTFTVTGTGNPAVTPAPTTTFIVTVN